MDTITSHMVKDQVIMKNLAALEQTGENGFATYHSGNTKAGSKLMEASMHQSSVNIRALHDPKLQEQANGLLHTANQAIAGYMKNPTVLDLLACGMSAGAVARCPAPAPR